jgi:hypothetical protein
MARVMINEYWDHGKKRPIRSYTVLGGLIPPFTMSIGSKKYIMPGWYKLDNNTETLPNIEDIKFIPYKPKEDNIPNIDRAKEYKVTSSKGDKVYIVNANSSGSLQCTCMGYGFRRKCRHIDQIQSSL